MPFLMFRHILEKFLFEKFSSLPSLLQGPGTLLLKTFKKILILAFDANTVSPCTACNSVPKKPTLCKTTLCKVSVYYEVIQKYLHYARTTLIKLHCARSLY